MSFLFASKQGTFGLSIQKGVEDYNYDPSKGDIKEETEKNNFKGGIVATPTKTHYKISKEFIKNKIPIILEKTAAFNVIEVKKMIYYR